MALTLGYSTNRIINPANLFSLAVALAISLLGLGTSSYAHSFADFEVRPTQQIKINCRNTNIVLPSPISIERQLKGGECEAYSLLLTSGQYAHVVVDQRGIDVALTFRGPGGQETAKLDRWSDTRGLEMLSLIASEKGEYQLEVRAVDEDAPVGGYVVQTVEVRTSNSQDLARIAAESAYEAADELDEKNDPESKRGAVAKLEQSLKFWRLLQDNFWTATTLFYIGTIRFSLDESDKAMGAYQEAFSLWQALGDQIGQIAALSSIGRLYDSYGKYQDAIDSYERALPLAQVAKTREWGEAYVQHNLGMLYTSLGEYEKAVEYYDKALEIRRSENDGAAQAHMLHHIGEVYLLAGDSEKAVPFLEQALQGSRSAEDRLGEATALNHLGRAYFLRGEMQKALDYYNRALNIRKARNYYLGIAQTLNNIGAVFEVLNQYSTALNYYEQALPLRRNAGDRRGEAETLYGFAHAEWLQGNRDQARAHLEEAITIVEALRLGVGSPELRTSYFATAQDYYEFQIEMLMDLDKEDPNGGFAAAALQVSEQKRARSLLESLTKAGVDSQVMRDSLNRSSAQPRPLTVNEIQRGLLDPDTVLLEYALGKGRSYLWIVSQNSITGHTLVPRRELEAAARRLYQILEIRSHPPTNKSDFDKWQREVARADKEYPQAAMKLSSIILDIPPQQIANKRLLIVTEGMLQFIPFAVLPFPVKEGSSVSPPLVVNHEIVGIPSASTLSVLRNEPQSHKPPDKTVAVMADPVFESDDRRIRSGVLTSSKGQNCSPDSWLNRSARESGLMNGECIRRLPNTRREGKNILSLVPSNTRRQAFDFDASVANATSGDISRYRYVHFATHGFLNSIHPEWSAIVLSLFDQKGIPQDGFLRAKDISKMKLAADVVVLSACQTGLGKDVKGEGFIGLTRAFMYAGSPRVVVSLWSVDDVATAELMVRFYKGMLEQHISPAKALQVAQVSMLKEKRFEQPFYWAAFVIQGEWR